VPLLAQQVRPPTTLSNRPVGTRARFQVQGSGQSFKSGDPDATDASQQFRASWTSECHVQAEAAGQRPPPALPELARPAGRRNRNLPGPLTTSSRAAAPCAAGRVGCIEAVFGSGPHPPCLRSSPPAKRYLPAQEPGDPRETGVSADLICHAVSRHHRSRCAARSGRATPLRAGSHVAALLRR